MPAKTGPIKLPPISWNQTQTNTQKSRSSRHRGNHSDTAKKQAFSKSDRSLHHGKPNKPGTTHKSGNKKAVEAAHFKVNTNAMLRNVYGVQQWKSPPLTPIRYVYMQRLNDYIPLQREGTPPEAGTNKIADGEASAKRKRHKAHTIDVKMNKTQLLRGEAISKIQDKKNDSQTRVTENSDRKFTKMPVEVRMNKAQAMRVEISKAKSECENLTTNVFAQKQVKTELVSQPNPSSTNRMTSISIQTPPVNVVTQPSPPQFDDEQRFPNDEIVLASADKANGEIEKYEHTETSTSTEATGSCPNTVDYKQVAERPVSWHAASDIDTPKSTIITPYYDEAWETFSDTETCSLVSANYCSSDSDTGTVQLDTDVISKPYQPELITTKSPMEKVYQIEFLDEREADSFQSRYKTIQDKKKKPFENLEVNSCNKQREGGYPHMASECTSVNTNKSYPHESLSYVPSHRLSNPTEIYRRSRSNVTMSDHSTRANTRKSRANIKEILLQSKADCAMSYLNYIPASSKTVTIDESSTASAIRSGDKGFTRRPSNDPTNAACGYTDTAMTPFDVWSFPELHRDTSVKHAVIDGSSAQIASCVSTDEKYRSALEPDMDMKIHQLSQKLDSAIISLKNDNSSECTESGYRSPSPEQVHGEQLQLMKAAHSLMHLSSSRPVSEKVPGYMVHRMRKQATQMAASTALAASRPATKRAAHFVALNERRLSSSSRGPQF